MKKQSSQPAASPTSLRPTAAVGGGLLLVCIALFVSNLTVRTLLFWHSKADYVRTELEVTGYSPAFRDPLLLGKVRSTGEEVHYSVFPSELFKYDSSSDATGSLISADEARGKLIPIWFAKDHGSFFTAARIYYVSEFETPPSGIFVLKLSAVNLAILLAGAWLFRWGARETLARTAS